MRRIPYILIFFLFLAASPHAAARTCQPGPLIASHPFVIQAASTGGGYWQDRIEEDQEKKMNTIEPSAGSKKKNALSRHGIKPAPIKKNSIPAPEESDISSQSEKESR